MENLITAFELKAKSTAKYKAVEFDVAVTSGGQIELSSDGKAVDCRYLMATHLGDLCRQIMSADLLSMLDDMPDQVFPGSQLFFKKPEVLARILADTHYKDSGGCKIVPRNPKTDMQALKSAIAKAYAQTQHKDWDENWRAFFLANSDLIESFDMVVKPYSDFGSRRTRDVEIALLERLRDKYPDA